MTTKKIRENSREKEQKRRMKKYQIVYRKKTSGKKKNKDEYLDDKDVKGRVANNKGWENSDPKEGKDVKNK